MSATVSDAVGNGDKKPLPQPQRQAVADQKTSHYKGFVAGVFSGIAKLSVGHPFDTIKVRLQTSTHAQFKGPIDCVLKTFRNEGVSGFYKGATPPLVGWMAMDSLMLGSLTAYRRLLNEHIFNPHLKSLPPTATTPPAKLPLVGHGLAGMLAGWTVSFIAAPVEHVKARLQIQYAATKSQRLYSGPLDCSKKLIRGHGMAGLYHGLGATLLFRTFFFFWWSSYALLTELLHKHTALSTPAVNFWAGGLSAQVFWITSYPSDVVKQRIMTDALGPGRDGSSGGGPRKYPRWRDAAVDVYRRDGWRGYWRGFGPCFLRAFPANAMALVAFEGVMRALP
ncbi:mitochondrial carrier [Aulographum hederae CBS 113979]|uniref:Mitochondrial carrier n=1 Tax=Aulographum hederae CBS 113979 TaxID=1176131 RepID=A0A6G1GR62_9PEZI|nr:mitochondrial carrier [Aulographum hederae CBS 113979]